METSSWFTKAVAHIMTIHPQTCSHARTGAPRYRACPRTPGTQRVEDAARICQDKTPQKHATTERPTRVFTAGTKHVSTAAGMRQGVTRAQNEQRTAR